MIEGFRLGVFSRGATLWDGLDFAFGDAAAWFVTGPPSSGKTLLLSILRGERRPDAGDVVVSGGTPPLPAPGALPAATSRNKRSPTRA
jgi:ABC-type transport system involved in cytochrome c biogenesis ATPase subunit